MSNSIGQLTRKNQNGQTEYDGYVRSLQFSLKFRLVPNPHKNQDAHPDYVALVMGQTGEEVSIGSAWINQSTPKMMGDEPKDYLRIVMDDMSFPNELWLTAFESRESSDKWNIVWSRAKSQTA